jgi:hypothetical protein
MQGARPAFRCKNAASIQMLYPDSGLGGGAAERISGDAGENSDGGLASSVVDPEPVGSRPFVSDPDLDPGLNK